VLESLPASLKHLTQLETFTLNNLPNLTALPNKISQLRNLKILKLISMRSLKVLPANVGKIKTLQAIIVSNTNPELEISPACMPFIKKE
jgi:Leucine-rich repeat (LRR) protein